MSKKESSSTSLPYIQTPTQTVKAGTASIEAPWPVAKPPRERGITPQMNTALMSTAVQGDLYIESRNSNPAGLVHMAKPDAFPKPQTVKAKSATTGPNAGLAIQGGKGYFPDIDTHTVRPVSNPKRELSDHTPQAQDLRQKINQKMTVPMPPVTATPTQGFRAQPSRQLDMLQHGSHDAWKDRNSSKKAGTNVGPQGNSTAYYRGKAYHLDSVETQMDFRKQVGMPFPYTQKAITESQDSGK